MASDVVSKSPPCRTFIASPRRIKLRAEFIFLDASQIYCNYLYQWEQLYFALKKERDPVAEIEDPKEYLVRSLNTVNSF